MLLSDYEATIARMIEDGEGQKRRDEETRRRLGEEKEQALDDLRGVETAFSDLHRRYERLKEIIDTFQKNETILRSNVTQAQESLAQSERRYVALKEHAEGKIDAANDEIERVRGSQKNEMTVMAAKLKKVIVVVVVALSERVSVSACLFVCLSVFVVYINSHKYLLCVWLATNL